ncbi:MAG: hypothetical protein IJ189_11520 [Clostridia bacterium]|nr:hypothetical protein [Clostridia bacterium]
MKIVCIVCGILGAVIGAGFASGREIMHFFTCYGSFSWGLAILAAVCMGGIIYWIMGFENLSSLLPGGKFAWIGRGLMAVLLLGTAGSMTAAAGELAALTVPLRHARGVGLLLTLGICLELSKRGVGALASLGQILLPLTALAWGLCCFLPAEPAQTAQETWGRIPLGIGNALCYSAMNSMLSSGILCDAGRLCTPKERRQAAIGAGMLLGCFLLLGNGALIRHRMELSGQALPTVILLRRYGKMGYYLSALMLYLAVTSTLIAVLRGLITLVGYVAHRHPAALAGLLTALVTLGGFEWIVARVYPFMGLMSLAALLFSMKKSESR